MSIAPQQFKKAHEWSYSGIFFDVARVPDSARLYYGSSDFRVYEIDASVEKPEPAAFSGDGHQSYVTTVALGANELVSGSYDGRLIWWNTGDRKQVRAVDAHEKWIRNIVTSPDGSLIASVADDMVCRLWDRATGELKETLTDHRPVTPNNYPSMLYAVTISPDGRFLATADKVGHIVVRDLASGAKLAELDAPVMYTWDPKQRRHSIGGIRSLAFSHNSSMLAAGGIGKIGNIDHLGGPSRVEVFEWRSGKRLHELEDDKLKGLVEQIVFHPNGEWFLTAGGDHNGFITFYDTKTGKVIHQEKAPMHVHGFAFNEAWDRLYAVGHGKIAVWEHAAEETKTG